VASLAASQNSKSTVFETCSADSDCQQGCCGFSSGKCAPAVAAQLNGSGGCGFGNASPNCDVATLLDFHQCIKGAVQGDLSAIDVQAAAAFTAQRDNFLFMVQPASSPTATQSANTTSTPASTSHTSMSLASASTSPQSNTRLARHVNFHLF
jgi:hypothetical protein